MVEGAGCRDRRTSAGEFGVEKGLKMTQLARDSRSFLFGETETARKMARHLFCLAQSNHEH
jgi:hypothetical protein